MRILLVVDNYFPERRSQAKLIHDLAIELRDQGHDAAVLAPSDRVRATMDVSVEEGIRVYRARAPSQRDISNVLRAIREERLSATLWRASENHLRGDRRDLVVYYSPTIFLGRFVRKLKSAWGAKSYLVLRDIFPEWAVNAGLIRRNGPVHAFFRLRELEQYYAADVIGVQSPKNLSYFDQTWMPFRRRLEVLYNWTKLDEPDLVPTNHRRRLGLEGKVVFFYGGNIGVAQDLGNVVRLAASLRQRTDIHFLLVGEGTEVARLRARIAAENLTNIELLPAVDQADYLAMMSEMDVGLISLDRRLGTENYPGKMLGYMQFSIPILASLNPGNELGNLLAERGAGKWAYNGDDERLRAAALALADDTALRRSMGASGRRLLEDRFSARAAATQIVRGALAAT